MDNLPLHAQGAAATAYYTGMRKGEIFNLTWDRVDLKNKIIELEIEHTKDKEKRYIPICESLFEILDKIIPVDVDTSIRLLVINYNITNSAALNPIAHILLFYFAWRFYLSSKKMIRHGYRKAVEINNFNTQPSFFAKILKRDGGSEYRSRHQKDFEQQLIDYANQDFIDNADNKDYSIHLSKLVHEGMHLVLHCQTQYHKMTGVTSFTTMNFTIKYKSHQLIWYKFWILLVFLTGKEETPDYLIPWLLFISAISTSILTHFGIKVSQFL